MTEPRDMTQLLPSLSVWLPEQRWYLGSSAPEQLEVVDVEVLLAGAGDSPGLASLVVRADGVLWHIPIGWRQAGDLPDAVADREGAVIGELGEGLVAYDAAPDFELAAYLYQLVTQRAQPPEHIRPVSAEQSNTSLICDDSMVIKLFRRIEPGPNPDVSVPEALSEAGFEHVPSVTGVWRRGEFDLAVAQTYLSGASDGFALALASVRDCLRSRTLPEEAGTDFAGEATRLGEVTAQLHLALAESFGTRPASPKELVADLASDLDRAGLQGVQLLDRLESLSEPGCLIQAHGDYHLGQVLRVDAGWYVLDFEGEPDRDAAERQRLASPLRDLAGMLRSFDYAAAVALSEQAEAEREELAPLADAWAARSRDALQLGYSGCEGIEALLPGSADRPVVLTALELEKAIYELGYERAHRPDWVHIPEAAITRLLGFSPQGAGGNG